MNVQEWIKKQKYLLDLERDSEIDESAQARAKSTEKELEARGICVRHLYIQDTRSGTHTN